MYLRFSKKQTTTNPWPFTSSKPSWQTSNLGSSVLAKRTFNSLTSDKSIMIPSAFQTVSKIVFFVDRRGPTKHLEECADNKFTMLAQCPFLENDEVIEINRPQEMFSNRILWSKDRRKYGRNHELKHKHRTAGHTDRITLLVSFQG